MQAEAGIAQVGAFEQDGGVGVVVGDGDGEHSAAQLEAKVGAADRALGSPPDRVRWWRSWPF
ncbi:hypothetical protein [Amycolatopsis sp. NBC_01488]|uniref:hypothetical protein n=1 Tax=Amycolatopsis sp. NBC_01488 TaxID=2903563 RepID=UPI003FA43CCE